MTVRVWNPHRDEQYILGQHRDYVKCLSAPLNSNWVVSAGLDRRIISWDLTQSKEKFNIDLGANDKNSIYALNVNTEGSIIAAGGPEAIVQLWDVRTRNNSPITKLVGHTSNIRSVLVSERGDWVLSGSSDSTIKLWSVTAGRLLHTFDMHEDSVWSLESDHPGLQVFYSADRTGVVAKTDLRNVSHDIDSEAGSVVLCNEHAGVSKVVSAGGYVWTATANSRIHRWTDIDNENAEPKSILSTQGGPKSNDVEEVTPVSINPVETLEGKIGLIKHRLLSDRQRVLTTDTAGEIVMWDLLKCVPLKSFGTGLDLDLLADQLGTPATMANWCQVSTRTGELYVTLEENTCFDAEVYADEIIPEIGEDKLKEYSSQNPGISDLMFDQRINLGKWVIRNLFTKLLTEEINKDRALRTKLVVKNHGLDKDVTTDNIVNVQRMKTREIDALEQVVEPPVVTPPPPSVTPSPPKEKSGFMKRFGFGKKNKKQDDSNNNSTSSNTAAGVNTSSTAATPTAAVPSAQSVSAVTTTVAEEENNAETLAEVVTNLQKDYNEKARTASDGTALFPSAFTPPMPHDLPIMPIPEHTKVLISELGKDSGGLVDIYRGSVGSLDNDADKLGKLVPAWIANVLLLDTIPDKPEIKVGFILVPCDETEQAGDGIEPLPEIQQGGGRLNGYQMLRAHKAASYLVEKLKLTWNGSLEPEEVELLCQGVVVPSKMTLGTVRTRYWRSGRDVILKYRRKKVEA